MVKFSKFLALMGVCFGTAMADRYLTEMEELIMQVKRDTDGKERISWKETLTKKMQRDSEFTSKVKKDLLIPRLGNHYSYHDCLVVID